MKIGKYKLQIIETGTFSLDGGTMFGVIPKTLWEKTNSADSKNRIKLAARCLLLSDGIKNILIDTGCGYKWDEKAKSIYNFEFEQNNLEKSLNDHGVLPDKINDVFLTHLHFDHTGGSTILKDGKIEPTFPNASYYVQKKNYDWAINPTEKDRGSFIKENFIPLYENDVIKFINGEEQFDDTIELVVLNGHTFGQQLIKISDSSQTLLFCGDLIPVTSHLNLPYLLSYDLQPLLTLEEKKRILDQAVEEDWILFLEHDPEIIAVKVQKTEKGYAVKEKINIS